MLGNLLWKVNSGRYQLLVPRVLALREWALSQSHNAVGAGHLGRDKTYAKLHRRFYWAGMNRDTQEYCATCVVCQFTKKRKHRPDGVLHPLPVPMRRLESVSL